MSKTSIKKTKIVVKEKKISIPDKYKTLINLTKGTNIWKNKVLINKTYNFIKTQIVGNKTKKLSRLEIEKIEKLNKDIDFIFKINSDKAESLHNKKQLANMTNFEAMEIFLNHSKKTTILLGDKKNDKIVLSVVLPLFRAKNIAWVSLESLIRQEGVNFEWELIVIEEQFENFFGLDEILKYKNQLETIGCVSIKYISLNKWIPLSAKWYFLIQESCDTSEMIAFCAADMYQSKHRLAKQYKILKSTNKNWYKISENIVYDLGSNSHVIFTVPEEKYDSCSVMASKNLVKNLPLVCIKKHVDSWLHNTLLKVGLDYFYDDESELKNDTINVNGINNLSFDRDERIIKIEPPLKKCCEDLKNHIPEDIVNKFELTINYVNHHKKIIEDSNIKLRFRDHK